VRAPSRRPIEPHEDDPFAVRTTELVRRLQDRPEHILALGGPLELAHFDRAHPGHPHAAELLVARERRPQGFAPGEPRPLLLLQDGDAIHVVLHPDVLRPAKRGRWRKGGMLPTGGVGHLAGQDPPPPVGVTSE
jgi:hypothetical protein